jgi:hypothetical protein
MNNSHLANQLNFARLEGCLGFAGRHMLFSGEKGTSELHLWRFWNRRLYHNLWPNGLFGNLRKQRKMPLFWRHLCGRWWECDIQR